MGEWVGETATRATEIRSLSSLGRRPSEQRQGVSYIELNKRRRIAVTKGIFQFIFCKAQYSPLQFFVHLDFPHLDLTACEVTRTVVFGGSFPVTPYTWT